MLNVETPNGYLVIERIGGMDVYMDDCLVCELCGSLTFYMDEEDNINGEALDEAIDDELDTLHVMERINNPYNFV